MTTLLILLDAFRYDYLDKKDTPFLWKLKEKSVHVKKLVNPGGYCERSVFMTGAGPDKTDNYFAFSLMPIGYKRAEYEPTFNIPMGIRSRLAMTEDVVPDFEPRAFGIESFWDTMREGKKTWAIEACVALGIRSYKGKSTHGSRPIQLASQIPQKHDLYYIQYSEVDQLIHYSGTDPDARRGTLKWADGSVEWLVNKFRKEFKEVNIIVFGDHGMDNIKKVVDIPLEYPPFVPGYDYLYLKSTAAIQFWIFNPKVSKYIKEDQLLKRDGKFIESPNSAQGDMIWLANMGTALSPCHFHDRLGVPKAMHGWDENEDTMKGMALIYDGKSKGEIDEGNLKDICTNVSNLVGVREPEDSEGVLYV